MEKTEPNFEYICVKRFVGWQDYLYAIVQVHVYPLQYNTYISSVIRLLIGM